MRRGDLAGALAEYDTYLRADPEHYVLRWRQMVLASRMQLWPRVVTSASWLLQSMRNFGPVLRLRAQALSQTKQLQSAVSDLLASLADNEMQPGEHSLSVSEICDLALRVDDEAVGLDWLNRIPATAASKVDRVSETRAVLLEKLRRLDEALVAWESALLSSRLTSAQRGRATLAKVWILNGLGRTREALAFAEIADREQRFAAQDVSLKQRLEFTSLLAGLLAKAGRVQEAIARFRELAESAPTVADQARAYRELGSMASAHHLYMAALEAYARALKLQTHGKAFSGAQHADLLQAYAVLLQEVGRKIEAQSVWSTLLELPSSTATQKRRAIMAQAWLLDAGGNSPKALEMLSSPPHQRLFATLRAMRDEAWRYHLLVMHLLEKTGKSQEVVRLGQQLQKMQLSAEQAVELHTRLGNLAMKRSDYRSALNSFLVVLRYESTPQMRQRAADAAWQLHDLKEFYSQVLPLQENPAYRMYLSTETRRRICQTYEEWKRDSKALACWETLSQEHPNEVVFMEQAAAAALRGNHKEKLLAHLVALYRQQPTAQRALDIGYLLSAQGQEHRAVEWFAASYRQSRAFEVASPYALSLLKEGKQEQAIAVLETSLSIRDINLKQRVQTLRQLAEVLAAVKDYQGAAATWYEVQTAAPTAEHRFRYFFALVQARDSSRALAMAGKVDFHQLPRNEQVLWADHAGTLWHQTGHFEQSLSARRLALALQPSASRYVALSDTLLTMGRASEAEVALRHALALAPTKPEYLMRAAYLYRRLGYYGKSTALLRKVRVAAQRRHEPIPEPLNRELGYTLLALNQNDRAASSFRRSIDEDALSRQDLDQTRRYVSELEHHATISLFEGVCINAAGCQLPTPIVGTSFPVAFGILSAAYRPPWLGLREGRTLELTARLLWANETESLTPIVDSMQGGIGARYKPFAKLNLYGSVEGLVRVGTTSQNNLLVRATWSQTMGQQWRSGVTSRRWLKDSQHYLHLYADVGQFAFNQQDLFLLGLARFGRTLQLHNQWQVAPFAHTRASATFLSPNDITYVELGGGLTTRLRFLFDHYKGYAHTAELFVTAGHDVYNNVTDNNFRILVGFEVAINI